MSDPPTKAQETESMITGGLGQSRPAGTSVRHARGLATYYRLRSIALEGQIRALEDELEQTERHLQSTIRRYEDLLQQPDRDWVVVTNNSPETESVTDD